MDNNRKAGSCQISKPVENLENQRPVRYYVGMVNAWNKNKKKQGKTGKNGLPVFDSDKDFLEIFENKLKPSHESDPKPLSKNNLINKHGVPVLDAQPQNESHSGDDEKEDFETLLNEYYKSQTSNPLKIKKPDPVPLKKRLKRYPPVEVELDLHGFRAIEAQVKVESFIQTCKHQGFFTIRIIVGKGLHSDEGPVLPDVVEDAIQKMKSRDLVIWHEWDRKKKSKSGALIVYLKQFDQFD